jgi:TolB-like protein
VNIAARALIFAVCAALLCGCASWRDAWSSWSLGPVPAIDPATQKTLDGLYARGAAALGRNDVDAAITAWRQYTATAPRQLPQARTVRGYLTLLDREAARRFAKRATAGERSAGFARTDRLHVALFPFTNQGPAGAPPANAAFNRALMAMIATDLGRVPALTVLEREKIDQLVQEMKLAGSGLVDRATLGAQAQLLGAGTIVAGSVYNEPGPSGPGSGRYKINTAVSDVKGARIIGTQEADGAQAEFFVLQKRVVYGILESLDIRDIPPAVNQVHTRSWAAYAQFARGLSLLAEDRFDEARSAFQAALGFDPAFALAEDALLATPEPGATLDSIRAQVRGAP